MFKALVLNKSDQGFSAAVQSLEESALPDADVLVQVDYSTLNYKDALAISNKGPVVRLWPMVAGIDGAGVVLESRHPDWKSGDAFIHTGWGVGETHWGCLAERAKLKGDWLVRLPEGLSTRQAMTLGTAGLTAMLCVLALERHFAAEGLKPADGEVLVTGATGGVGSVAVAVLAQGGYRVVACTGKPEQADYLKQLGASSIIDRAEFMQAGKPLQKERWMGAVDTLGSHTLANVCAQMRYRGAVAACGLAQGGDFPATVMPFILRNVALLGVDSVSAPRALREQAWQRLAQGLKASTLDAMANEISLNEVIALAQDMIAARTHGRTVVRVCGSR